MFLKPLKRPAKAPESYAIADVESRQWINFLMVGFYDGIKYRYFTEERAFIYFLFSEENDVNTIYSHNGGRFDFLFFMKAAFELYSENFIVEGMIPRGSSLLCFSVSEKFETGDDEIIKKLKKKQIISKENGVVTYRGRTITFWDSLAMLPFSQRSLAINFKVDHLKGEIDYEKMDKVTEEVITYNKSDCIGLYEIIEKYHNWPLIRYAGSAKTMAGQAMRVFRTFMKSEIGSLGAYSDMFVRGSYFGGRTEIFKPLYRGSKINPITCYDVNSLYPTVMAANDFPTHVKYTTNEYEPGAMGIYDAEVYVPEDIYVPPLGTMVEINKTSKFVFPVGQFRGRWSTIELEYARSVGVKILSTSKGIIFSNGGRIFEKYIAALYDIRLKAEKNSVDDILAKLLMNSCYGRFGIRKDREQVCEDTFDEGVSPLFDLKLSDGKIVSLMTKPVVLNNMFSNVAIAAWVTSLARIHMHKIYMADQQSLYYTDTDSLYTTRKFESGKSLGDLKKEYDMEEACFLLPKTYAGIIIKEDGTSQKKVVMKGFEKKIREGFTMNDFVMGLEGELQMLRARNPPKMATFRTAGRKGSLLYMMGESERQIRSKYDKRRIIKTRSGYDTEPLVIRDDVVINLN
jgi:hypothetical protein